MLKEIEGYKKSFKKEKDALFESVSDLCKKDNLWARDQIEYLKGRINIIQRGEDLPAIKEEVVEKKEEKKKVEIKETPKIGRAHV